MYNLYLFIIVVNNMFLNFEIIFVRYIIYVLLFKFFLEYFNNLFIFEKNGNFFVNIECYFLLGGILCLVKFWVKFIDIVDFSYCL